MGSRGGKIRTSFVGGGGHRTEAGLLLEYVFHRYQAQAITLLVMANKLDRSRKAACVCTCRQ
jgi:hypothetical protein